MFPGMNQRQMQQAMRKMGIQQEQLEAEEVIIRLADRDLVISNPDVALVNAMGQKTFQISGNYVERSRVSAPTITEEDIQTVVDQTGVSKEVAALAIHECNGDLADAILRLSEDD